MNKRNIALDLVLTLLLCGLWNAAVQYDHCRTFNAMLGKEKYSFFKLCIFSLLTCGLYYIYHEYQKANDFAQLKNPSAPDGSDAIIAVVLAIFGLGFVFDAILQSKINDYIDQKTQSP